METQKDSPPEQQSYNQSDAKLSIPSTKRHRSSGDGDEDVKRIRSENTKEQTFPIAVIGIGCRLPGDVNSTEDFWNVISQKQDVLTEIPKDRWSLDVYYSSDNKSGTHVTKRSGFVSDVHGFDNAFFKISPREAAMMDPQQRHLLEVTHQAFEDAGIIYGNRKERCGVYVGIGMVDFTVLLSGDRHLANSYLHTGVSHCVAANRISYVFDLNGPSLAIDTACASSMTSSHLACRALWNGECDMAVTCGSNILLLPEVTVGFSQLGVLSPEGKCCPFDESANGYVRGEGWASIILKPLHTAVADGNHIYSVISGSVIGDNGHNQSITMPSATAQEQLIRSAYSKFSVPMSSVDYVEAHGTGTPVGDTIEAEAIGKAFKSPKRKQIRIGSVKGHFGHLECAAGIVSIIKASLVLHNGQLCPTANYRKPNSDIDFESLKLTVQERVDSLASEKKNVVGVNSFGFGGALAHMIFENVPLPAKPRQRGCGWTFGGNPETGIPIIIPLSAKTDTSLLSLISKWAKFSSDVDAESVVGFIATKRRHYNKRAAFLADSGYNFRQLATEYRHLLTSTSHVITGTANENRTIRICGVFPGQGQQWCDMGRHLFKTEPVFRNQILRCDKLFCALSGYSLIRTHGVFTNDNYGNMASESVISQVEVSQPSILFFQVAIHALWLSWEVRPDVVVGHSLGEIAAAVASEALSLEDAVAVIYHRSRLQAKFIGKGAMAAYRASPADAQDYCAAQNDLFVSCINSPNSVTIAGDAKLVQDLVDNKPSIAKKLRVQCAFHTPHMEPMKNEFLKSAVINPSSKTSCSFYSSVTGGKVTGSLDVHYWWDNIRMPVDFLSATSSILQTEEITIFLEYSASPTLLSSVAQTVNNFNTASPLLIPSCQRLKDDRISVLRSLATAYGNGVNISWSNVYHDNSQWAEAPTYAWDHTKFQTESEFMKKNRLGLFDRTFKGQNGCIGIDAFPYLADHVVDGSIVFPGAGYIEFVLQMCIENNDKSSLQNIQFKQVLVLGEKEKSRIAFTRNGSTVKLFTPQGLHAEAQVTACPTRPQNLDIETICKNQTFIEIDSRSLYLNMKSLGLQYGPQFQVIKGIVVSEGEAIGFLKNAKAEEYIHIPTLDGCFQVALAALGIGSTVFLPTKINKLNLYARKLPTNEALIAYAKITDHWYGGLKADVQLVNKKGVVYLEILGFEAKNISGTTTSDTDIDGCLYTTEWQSPGACLPSTEIAYQVFSPSNLMQNYPDEMTNLSKVEPFMAPMTEIAVTYIVHALDGLNYAEVSSRSERYVKCLKSIASNYSTNVAFEDVDSKVQVLQTKIPEMTIELRMLKKLGELLPSALKEPSVATVPLFAADGLAEYFVNSLTTRIFYKAGSELVTKAVHEAFRHKSVVRILEVGGRMGGLARYVLGACSQWIKKGVLEYVFTDLNTNFFMHARQTLKDYPSVKYQTFDIEEAVGKQGFVPGSFDIVICMDTLHSVSKLSEGMKNMKGLLCENGWLIMYEATKGFLIRELIFGSLDMCWCFEDDRTETCWLSQQEWKDVFIANEMVDVVAVSTPNEFFHSIIVGRKQTIHNISSSRSETDSWVVFHDGAPEIELLTSALKGQRIETFSIHSIPNISDMVMKWDGQINVVYVWNKNDLYLITTLRLIIESYNLPQKIKSFWIVSRNGNMDCPYAVGGLPIGFSRVVSNEISVFPVFSLDIDDDALLMRTETITKLWTILHNHCSPDRELVLRKGNVYVPRLVRNNVLKDSAVVANTWRLEKSQRSNSANDVKFFKMNWPKLRDGQVLVRVKATGVNFKDVMMASGLLEDLTMCQQFGLECCGTVEELGPNVNGLQVGQEVIGFGDYCFSSHVVCDSAFVVEKPSTLSSSDAAGVITVYCTALHALIDRAGLKRGESVLIHSACGGVGLAAIQVARMVGAQIFCSAGNPEKRDYLKHTCNIDYVTDSHSTSFTDDVLRWTHGQGVDVILNSLSGDFISKGTEILKPCGRFCEIGKRDILANNSLPLQPLLENASFLSVQLDLLMKRNPSTVTGLLKRVKNLLQEKKLLSIPTTVKPISEYSAVFQWMKKGVHIGKIVLNVSNFKPEKLQPPSILFDEEATYLVTGGLGGIGQALVRWMAQKGARHIAIVSRHGCTNRLQRCTLQYLKEHNVHVYEEQFKADISSENEVDRLLTALLKLAPPLKGVFHLAAVIEDSSIANLTEEKLLRGLRGKAYGAYNLHKYTKQLNLDHFLMLSSISAVVGNPDQASYSAANAFLDALATKRRNMGLPALSVQIGAVRGAGFLETNKLASQVLHSRGFRTLHIAEYLEMIGKMLQRSDLPPVLTLSSVIWNQVLFLHKDMLKFRHLATTENTVSEAPKVSQEDLEEQFINKLSELLYIAKEAIDKSRPLTDYGVDSLMAVDMVNWVNKEFGMSISQLDILGGMTIDVLLKKATKGEVVISF